MERPLIAILDNKDQLLCVTDEYEGGNLHTYLLGTAAFFRCSILQKSAISPFFKVGNKISFIYKNTAYHFDITDMVKNEKYVTVQADSLTLELRNEDASEYKAAKAMTFEEYLKVFLFAGDNPLVMGINEVADKKLQLEWEGSEDDLLARLFSLATRFDAEIEFVTQLNQHWGLSQIVLNVYKANDDKNQGVGNNRQDVLLEWGNNVETIEVKDNIDNLKTAIKPIGTDGLTIAGIEIDERDKDGNQLFYSPKASAIIYAVQARNIFMAKMNGEGYIKKNWSYETKNQNTLAGQALAQLKKLSQVEVTVTIKSYEYLGIGDTVRALNTEYQPALNLSVRVSEQDIYFDEPNRNQTKFTNAQILQSEVDTTLLTRVQALIEANKVFTNEIITSDGVTFKNGFGSTTLTARVRDGIKDVTDTFSLKWYKNGTLFSNTKTVTINAADIEEKAVFRFEVADDSGNVRGGAEVTVTNIDDGKEGEPGKPGETFYPHRGYLMADGTLVNQVPNTNDLRIAQSKFFAYQGSTVSRTEGVSVPEWGATDAIRHVISGGTGGTVAAVMATGVLVKANVKYVHSVYIKNQGTTKIRLNNNLSQAIDVDPGETKRVIFNPAGNATGNASKQFVLYRINASDVQDFILWRPKIEESETTATYWTPSPLDDYENAYPKYEGFYSDTNQAHSTDPDKYKPWTPFMGPQGGQGPKGDSAPLISLSGATQAITVDKDGKITPASSFAVNGTAVNTAISNWTYSLNGGNFGSAVPTGVTRSGNIVTIDPTKAVFNTLTIKAADTTVSDVFTISRIKDGVEGSPGSDAYTVFLTNESFTFAGSTTAALAGSTTTEVIVYKGINKITPTSITVGTKPTGLSSSVSGSIITLTATTALVSKSGTVPITITADGKSFTKQFSYALSLQGGKGDPGDPGKGVSAEEISYAISQDGTTPPTSGWSGTRPTPKAGWYMWTRTRFKYTDNTYSTYFYLVAQQGKDAIIISATAPTNPAKEDLWQDPNDTTSTVYKWDGTKWIHWGISIDNLIASNVQIENGVFKRVEGALIVGSEFSNPYTRRYDDGTIKIGELTIKDAETRNAGVIRNSSGLIIQSYEQVISDQFIHMSRYEGDSIGDQTKLIASASMTFDLIQLNNREAGFAGSLSAEMLYDTGWLKVIRLKGTAGDIYLKRYMNRILIRFDQFVWNGSANGASTSNAVAILPDKVREGFPQMFTVPVWIEGNATEKFQVENGRLYKLSNNSGNSRITAVGEVYI
ncbi:phage tail protein [Enterococcus casseliflavus]|uniref:phage tail protein n=1 Tax=Enterococcus casseliflavus TaxID=37734 RepID=UPI001E574881|nr:phage tail protein [Enterococcus casseliflavus]MCD5191583.1 phage tail protein [Enterococcus casseliflavus]